MENYGQWALTTSRLLSEQMKEDTSNLLLLNWEFLRMGEKIKSYEKEKWYML